jgi:hypothetical protein
MARQQPRMARQQPEALIVLEGPINQACRMQIAELGIGQRLRL